jgi:hypothetical protein
MIALGTGDGREVVGLGLGSSTDVLSIFMISYEGTVGLKPTWKANLCFLLFVATIVSGSILALITK